MNEKTLLKIQEDWEQSGLLDSTCEEKKIYLAIKLQESQDFLIERNGGDEVETLIFPVIVRAFKENENFEALPLICEFINDFEKIDLETEFICNWIKNKFNK